MNKIAVIGVCSDHGASRRGAAMGPAFIRSTDFLTKLSDLGIEYKDYGDLICPQIPGDFPPNMKNLHSVRNANNLLYAQVSDAVNKDLFPVVLGGDHAIAAASARATLNKYPDAGIIWIDAHGDFNNHESTGTGNMHGMPLSALCGLGPEEILPDNSGNHYFDPHKVVLVGVRDVDMEERARLRKAGVNVFSISDIDRQGMFNIMNKAIALAGSKIHLSFDIDSVTPQEAPGTGTPVHSGLTVREAFLSCEMLYESGKLVAMDMVEVNSTMDDRSRTANLAGELILSSLGKTVY